MGTWGVNSFGNDNAGDWAWELEKVDDLSVVEEAIERVLDCGDEYVESPDAEAAIAAAEVLARLQGRHGVQDAYSEAVDNWVKTHPITPPPALVQQTLKALDRILRDPSELLDCWQDSDDLQGWTAAVEDLKKRLTT